MPLQIGQFLAVWAHPAAELATAARSSRLEERLVPVCRRPRAQIYGVWAEIGGKLRPVRTRSSRPNGPVGFGPQHWYAFSLHFSTPTLFNSYTHKIPTNTQQPTFVYPRQHNHAKPQSAVCRGSRRSDLASAGANGYSPYLFYTPTLQQSYNFC